MVTRAILLLLTLLLSVVACGPELPVPVDIVTVRLVAQDRSWHASYALDGIDVPTGREVHVPLGAGVRLALSSPDFISTFTVDDLDLRHFAAPDLPKQVTFFASRVGRHELRGDEMCGRPQTEHASGWLVIDRPSDYQEWVRTRARERR